MVICDTGLCEDRDYEVVVQFEASPEPDEVGSVVVNSTIFVVFHWVSALIV